MTVRPVYLDNHATTRPDPRVVAAMWPYFTESYGNAASVNHEYGHEAARAVERARRQIADLIQVEPRDLIFTSGATEANNLAIKGTLLAARGGHVITCATEHRSVLDPLLRMGRRGARVTTLTVDEFGRVDPRQIADAIAPDTILVSIMAANNEIGTLQPVGEIASLCQRHAVPFHTDAVQITGKLPFDCGGAGLDLASLSAHKLYGPKGIGVLYLRRGEPRIRIEPLMDGGGHERKLRSGTLAVPLIVGMGRACELARQAIREANSPQPEAIIPEPAAAGEVVETEQELADLAGETARIRHQRDWLQRELFEQLDGLYLNGHPTERLPGNLNLSFEGVDGEALMGAVSAIAVSAGSACTTSEPEPSHVLRAIGRSEHLTRASLRFGLGRFTTQRDLETAVEVVVAAVRKLRKVLPRGGR